MKMCVSPAFKTMKRLTHFSQASKCAFVPSKQNHRIWSNVPIRLQPCVINATILYNSRLTQPPSWLLKYSVLSCFKQSGWYSIFCRSWRDGNHLCLQPHSKIVDSYSKLVVCRKYSSKSEDQKDVKNRDIVHEVLQRKKERLKETGQLIIKDIKETRNKMKEKMEEVIERENIWTIPNLLCVLRIGFSPLLGYFIVQSEFNLALALLTLAGISDVLDGWIARTFQSQASKMGSFLDPMADKVLVGVLFLSLTYMDLIPVILTGTIIARDLLLVGAGFYIRYQSLPLPRTLSRYFDVTYATAQLAPTTISKVNTAVQLLMVASTLAAPVFNYVDHPLLHMLWYITAGTTITSAVSYLVTKDTYKFFKPNK